MTTKKCFKCGVIKPLEKFYVHSEMADGHLGKCISCTKKDVNTRYYEPESRKRIKEYEAKRFKDPERKKKIYLYALKRKELHPGKTRANRKVTDAIKTGRLVRKPCEVCGEVKSQAHHSDYRKYLDVRWLCFKHHRELHNQIINP